MDGRDGTPDGTARPASTPGKGGAQPRFSAGALRAAAAGAQADWMALSASARDRIGALPLSKRREAMEREEWLAPEHKAELDRTIDEALAGIEKRQAGRAPAGARTPEAIYAHWTRARVKAETQALAWARANRIPSADAWWLKAGERADPPRETTAVPHMLELHADAHRAKTVRDVLGAARGHAAADFWNATPLARLDDIPEILREALQSGAAGWTARHPPPAGRAATVAAVGGWWAEVERRALGFEGPIVVMLATLFEAEPASGRDGKSAVRGVGSRDTLDGLAERLRIAAQQPKGQDVAADDLSGGAVTLARNARKVIDASAVVGRLGGGNVALAADATDPGEVRRELAGLARELGTPEGQARVRARERLNRIKRGLTIAGCAAAVGSIPALALMANGGWSPGTLMRAASAALQIPLGAAWLAAVAVATAAGLLAAAHRAAARGAGRAYVFAGCAVVSLWTASGIARSMPIYRLNANAAATFGEDKVPLRGAVAWLHPCPPDAEPTTNGEPVVSCITVLVSRHGVANGAGLLTRANIDGIIAHPPDWAR